jgi:hypothetical protein
MNFLLKEWLKMRLLVGLQNELDSADGRYFVLNRVQDLIARSLDFNDLLGKRHYLGLQDHDVKVLRVKVPLNGSNRKSYGLLALRRGIQFRQNPQQQFDGAFDVIRYGVFHALTAPFGGAHLQAFATSDEM